MLQPTSDEIYPAKRVTYVSYEYVTCYEELLLYSHQVGEPDFFHQHDYALQTFSMNMGLIIITPTFTLLVILGKKILLTTPPKFNISKYGGWKATFLLGFGNFSGVYVKLREGITKLLK